MTGGMADVPPSWRHRAVLAYSLLISPTRAPSHEVQERVKHQHRHLDPQECQYAGYLTSQRDQGVTLCHASLPTSALSAEALMRGRNAEQGMVGPRRLRGSNSAWHKVEGLCSLIRLDRDTIWTCYKGA